jgi:hypothetical protein
MSRTRRYEAEALGVTPEGTTPGQHTLTEGFCSASARAPAPSAQLEGGGAWSGGGRERAALRPGFGAAPQGQQHGAKRRPAGGRVTPPANDVSSSPKLDDRSQIRAGLFTSSNPRTGHRQKRPCRVASSREVQT